MMEKVYPFKDIHEIIHFVRRKNPARFKRVDISELQPGAAEDYTGEWCEAASLLFNKLKRLKNLGDLERRKVLAFEAYYLPPTDERPGRDQLAKMFGRSEKQVGAWLAWCLESLDRHFTAHGWLEPLD